ncbi:hypothetical protein EGW08_015147, partial [Elysia chlorotica]
QTDNRQTCNSAGTVVALRLVVVTAQFDWVWELAAELHVCLLCHGVLGNCLECLLNVDGLLGRCFKVRNVPFRVAPTLGTATRHLRVREIIVHVSETCFD